MTSSLYCETCDVNWPGVPGYAKCPGCGGSNAMVPGMAPLGTNEAAARAHDMTLSRQRHEQFAAFCAERDAPKIEAACAAFRAELDAFSGVPG